MKRQRFETFQSESRQSTPISGSWQSRVFPFVVERKLAPVTAESNHNELPSDSRSTSNRLLRTPSQAVHELARYIALNARFTLFCALKQSTSSMESESHYSAAEGIVQASEALPEPADVDLADRRCHELCEPRLAPL